MSWGWGDVNRSGPVYKGPKKSGGGGGNKGCGGKKKMFGALFAVLFVAAIGVAQVNMIIQMLV